MVGEEKKKKKGRSSGTGETLRASYWEKARLCHLFARLSDALWQQLRPAIHQEKYPVGTTLFLQGDPFDRFFLVLKGSVKLYRLAPDGREKVIEVVGVGQTFAEAVMFAQKKHFPVNAGALADTVVLSVLAPPYLALLRLSIDTCFEVMAGMSQRLHGLLMEVDRVTLQSAKTRLLSLLLQEAKPVAGGGGQLVLGMSRKVLASRLSIQPETLSRLFRALLDDGIMEEKGRTIVIPHLESVRASILDG